MEALQRLHMAPVGGGPFGMAHHDPAMMRANIPGQEAGDRKSPLQQIDSRLIMQVGKYLSSWCVFKRLY